MTVASNWWNNTGHTRLLLLQLPLLRRIIILFLFYLFLPFIIRRVGRRISILFTITITIAMMMATRRGGMMMPTRRLAIASAALFLFRRRRTCVFLLFGATIVAIVGIVAVARSRMVNILIGGRRIVLFSSFAFPRLSRRRSMATTTMMPVSATSASSGRTTHPRM